MNNIINIKGWLYLQSNFIKNKKVSIIYSFEMHYTINMPTCFLLVTASMSNFLQDYAILSILYTIILLRVMLTCVPLYY